MIFDYAKSNQLFEEVTSKIPEPDTRGSSLLQKRAGIREASFRVHRFGAEAFTSIDDATYVARDQVGEGTRELQVCRISTLVEAWSQDLQVSPALISELESWLRPLRGPQPISAETELALGFDLQWLEAPAEALSELWCALHDWLIQSTANRDKYKLLMLLSTLAFALGAKQDLVQTLLAFATVPALRDSFSPSFPNFSLNDGYAPNRLRLTNIVKMQLRQFKNTPDFRLPANRCEGPAVANDRRQRLYTRNKNDNISRFVDDLMSQWPVEDVRNPTDASYASYILIDNVMSQVRLAFRSWHRNSRFREHIRTKQAVLDTLSARLSPLTRYMCRSTIQNYRPQKTHVKFQDLISNTEPQLPETDMGNFGQWIESATTDSVTPNKLKDLLKQMSTHYSVAHEQHYLGDLSRSLEALGDGNLLKLKESVNPEPLLREHLGEARSHARRVHQELDRRLRNGVQNLTQISGMLPRLSTLSILSYLASDQVDSLPSNWKYCFIRYGLAIAALQRAKRLVASVGHKTEFLNELQNCGHQDWNPRCHPDWLLLEIESDIFIRQEQAQIAQQMIAPASGSNSVLQLNMGLGKSSVIVPMVAATLADTSQLVRVIVLKPLAMQMFHLLVTKLGGLLNRRVIHMPISRSLKLTVPQARQIAKLYEECQKNRAILLLQPEHILSFELMGFEQLISRNLELGNIMTETQRWLHANSRDILDESDEILSVRFELIYTMGTQRPIDFSPDRWAIVQHVLELVSRVAPGVQKRFPHGIEVIPAPAGAFPRIRILESAAESKAFEELLVNVSKEICASGLPGVPIWNLSHSTKAILFNFLTDPSFNMDIWNTLVLSFSEVMKNGLLLLKGLFAGGILKFALQEKRWRVNFGLDLSRSMLAVPYHGKDTPSPRAEFSHPDTTILLTCLSYYYGRLSHQEVSKAFEALNGADRGQEEYTSWVKDSSNLPQKFHHLDGVNLSDSGQFSREVFPPLRSARRLINFYMSSIVFPAEMKEFPQKLSSSGWDIARKKGHPTTGFSGTNDSRYVLPLSINQCDLQAQLSTNALVLDCLLRPENTFIDVEKHSITGPLDAKTLLVTVSSLEQPARVIIDVGAQVLEMRNEEFAEAWLSRTAESKAEAVVFFNSQDEKCVLTRDGRQEPLVTSPYDNHMDQCLVYLDESHTRGTDLKLPTDYRALVTLGPALTKDRLVQACMRMRKLGKGQSVIFCGSLEIQRKIISLRGESQGPIEVSDVLRWCIATTCTDTRKRIPLWATQGIRHQSRSAVDPDSSTSLSFAESLLEDEAKSLEQRYGSQKETRSELLFGIGTSEADLSDDLHKIYAKCREFNVVSFDNATIQEEQERELHAEIEREHQVERLPAFDPHPHSIHPDVRRLVTNGIFIRSSDAFQPAFQSLSNTSVLDFYEPRAWPKDLTVTRDFSRTIQTTEDQLLDHFLRPVHWILSCQTETDLVYVIVSPFEAQELLPSIRKCKKATLHIYFPRTSQSVKSFEDLSFCVIPTTPRAQPDPAIIIQLNLFAGQLYFRTFEEYSLFCSLLGLCAVPPEKGITVASDGFINPSSRVQSNYIAIRECRFMSSPVDFVKRVVVMRRKGQAFEGSHLGKILNGELIPRDCF